MLTRSLGIVPAAVLWAAGLLPASEPLGYREIGHDHFFNLEYDLAIEAYRSLVDEYPADFHAYNYLSTAILYQELLRLGMLETSAFKGDNEFLKSKKPKPDPEVGREFERVLLEGRKLAQAALQESPGDVQARYALSTNYGLHGNQQFMIKKSYFGALRNGNRANKHSRKILKHNSDFVDAYLVAGVHEYVIGSLPWAIRALIVFGGIHGNKKKAKSSSLGSRARDELPATSPLAAGAAVAPRKPATQGGRDSSRHDYGVPAKLRSPPGVGLHVS